MRKAATRIRADFPASCSFSVIDSPVGPLMLIASDQGLHALLWQNDLKSPSARSLLKSVRENAKHPVLVRAKRQLEEYFAGKRRKFDLPLLPSGTPFQRKVWQQLSKIPYGETISYQEEAKVMGDAKKTRAVASANAKNPLCIFVPCHRVIAKDGSLSGFAGGPSKKKFLLDLEKAD